MIFARSKWYTIALAFVLLTLASCESANRPSSMSVGPSQMSLTAPGLLSRAVDSNALFAEVTLRYDTDSGTFTRTETASRTNGSNTWDVNLDIPANTEFVLDIVWYDMADPERVNLTSLSRTFSTAGANDVLTLSFDFAEFDSSAFNIDSDRFTNLEERVNGTSPFINDDLIVDDAGVFRYEEGVVYTINPRASEQDTTPVIGARWRRLPTSSNNAIACGAQAGFDATLAAGSLEEACTTADNCTFDFDQVDPVSQTGTGIEFSVEVPPLQASVGLSYGLEITNSAQQVSFVDIEFCLIAINEAPVAVDDSFTVTEGIPFEVTADQGVNLLSNDTDDIDVSNMPLVVDTTPTRLPSMASTFTLRSDGGFSYLYDPVAANASNADLTDSFEYTITDGIFTSTASVTLDIVLIDRPPVQTREIPAQTAVVGIDTAFDLSSSFDDPEDSELTFSAVAQTLPPSGGLSVSDVGLFGGIAESGDEGTYVVEIVARDQTSSVAASFALEVIENQRPIARAIADLDDVAAGQVISIDAGRNFSDPEGEPLRFTLESRPDSGLQINRNSGLITGQIAEPGDYNITVSASDGITQPVSSEFTITRVPTPAPILSDPSPGSLRLSAQVSDSDSGSISFGNTGNAPLTFSVRSDQAWLTTNTDSGRLGVGDRDELVVSAECGQSVETRMGTLTIGGNGGEKTVSVSLECIEAQVAILGDPDPDVLSLSALVSDGDGNGSENSDSDTFSFSNVGNAELNYSVSSNQPWLSVSADSGSLNPGGRDQVDVTAACGPEVDTRMGTITIGGNGGEKTVSVTLECSEAQVAILDDPSPDSLSLAALVSDGEDDGSAQRDSGTFNFSNTGTAVLTYSVSSNQPWLSVSSTDGSLNPGDSDQVNVTAVCGRAVETRRGVITLGGNGGEKTVAVSLACSEAQIPILGDPDPQDINLAAQVSGGDGPGSSDSGAFRIGNVGTAELLIAVSSNQPWLSASTDSGSLAPGESRQVEVSAVCGSAVETRTGVITIGGNGGEQTVSVSLVCSEAPVAVLGDPDPATLSLSAFASSGEGNGGSDSAIISFGNIGTAQLDYTVGSNQPWLSTSSDAGSLAPGESRQVEVSAVCGSAVETRTGVITIGGNGGEQTVSVSLVCSEAPVAVLGDPDPATLSLSAFASSGEGNGGSDSAIISFGNIGTAQLDYTVRSNQPWLSTSSDAGSLAAGESRQVEVSAVCGPAVETRTGVITIGGNGGEQTVSVSLVCSEAPVAVLGDPDPATLSLSAFASSGEGNGGSDSAIISFGNIGTAQLDYTVRSNQPWLSTSSDAGSLAPGESRQVEVSAVCGPAVETRTGVITIGGNGGEQTVSVSLVCSEAPVAVLGDPDPATLSLSAPVFVGDGADGSDSASIQFSNDGNAQLSYSIVSNEPWLGVSTDDGSLAAGRTAVFGVLAVCGGEVEVRMGSITISGNGGEKTVPVSLDCFGLQVVPDLDEPSPNPLELSSFPLTSEPEGGRDSGTVTFGNIGNGELTYSVFSNQPWLSAGTDTTGSLAPGESAQLQVTASCGQIAEVRTGSLTIESDGGTRMVTVNLTCQSTTIFPD